MTLVISNTIDCLDNTILSITTLIGRLLFDLSHDPDVSTGR